MFSYGNLDRVLDGVREGAEPAAEDDADRRRRLRPGTDGGDRSVELVLHVPTLHSFAVPWRWLLAAGLVALVAGGAASGAPQVKGPHVKAPVAIVIDASTGRVLWSKREHMRRPIASTTKIMTALVAMERLRPRDIVVVPKEATKVQPSKEYLRAGERVPVWKLYYGLLLESGNDTAVALAVAAGGTRERFLGLMNKKARALGLRHTHYRSASGLIDEGNYSTVFDLALLTRHALRNPRFRDDRGDEAQAREVAAADLREALREPQQAPVALRGGRRREDGVHARQRAVSRCVGDAPRDQADRRRPRFTRPLRRHDSPARLRVPPPRLDVRPCACSAR